MSEPGQSGAAGYLIATEVCAMLESRPEALMECLQALTETEQGQRRSASGDPAGALSLLRRAHARFETIREARPLLGIVKADLAAAYGNLQASDKAISYAEDSIAIVAGVQRLEFTEASARMTLGNSLGLLGKRHQSEEQYRIAEAILKGRPGSANYLQMLDSNRKQVLDFATKRVADHPEARYARLRRNFPVVAILAAVVAIAYFAWWGL